MAALEQAASPAKESTGWALAGLALLAVVWGTQYEVIRGGQATAPPLLTAALRFATVAVVGQLATLALRCKAPPGTLGARIGFGLAQGVSMSLLYSAQSVLPASLTAVLFLTSPFFVAGLAHRFLPGERLTLPMAAALLLGFVGVVTLVSGAGSTAPSTAAPTFTAGVACVAALAGALTGATNKVLAKRLTADVPMPVMLRDMGVVVTVVAGCGWLLFQRDAAVAFDGRGVASFLYLGLVASASASGLYLVLLRRYRVSALSYLQFVSALVAVVVGAVLTGTRFASWTVVGTLAVLAGLAVLARAQTRR